MKDRGRQLDQILHQYITYVKPAFEEFCLPVSSNFCCYLVLVIPQQHTVVPGIPGWCVTRLHCELHDLDVASPSTAVRQSRTV